LRSKIDVAEVSTYRKDVRATSSFKVKQPKKSGPLGLLNPEERYAMILKSEILPLCELYGF